MKKGISIWSFAAGLSLPEIFALTKKAGYDGVELALDETGPVSLESTAEDMAKVRAQAAAAGVELYSLATGLYWSYPLTSDDEAVRAKARHILRRQLQCAAWLGCGRILVIPGAVGVEFAPALGVTPYETVYLRAQEALRALAPEAQALGVVIGVENVWNKFLLSPLEMRNFIDSIGSEFVGSYFDVGNVVAFGYPEHWIPVLGKRIAAVHFKDYRREAGNLSGFVDLLSGDVNWPAVMRELRAVPYEGWVTAEMLPPYRYHPEQILFNTSAAMDAILR